MLDTTMPCLRASRLRELERTPHGTKFRFLVFSPDGTKLAVAGDSSSLSVYDVSTGQKILDHDLPSSGRSLAIAWIFIPGSPLGLAQLTSNGIVYLFRLDDKPPIKIKGHTAIAKSNLKGSMAASPNHSLMATSVGPELKLWEISAGGRPKLRFTYCNSSEDASHISNLSFINAGSHLLAFFMNEQIIVKIDALRNSDPILTKTFMRNVTASVSPSQERFVVHDPSQGAHVFDLGTLERIPDVMIAYSGPRIAIPVTFSQDGRFLFVGESGGVKIYDAIGKSLGDLGINCVRVLGMAVSHLSPSILVTTCVYEGWESQEIWSLQLDDEFTNSRNGPELDQTQASDQIADSLMDSDGGSEGEGSDVSRDPTLCPRSPCGEKIPNNPSSELTTFLQHYRSAVAEYGKISTQASRWELEVCLSINKHYQLQNYIKLAAERKWPVVNFAALPKRVLAMKEKLESVVLQEGLLGEGVMQTAFQKNMSTRRLDVEKLAARNMGPLDISRPGYYGTKGGIIIQSSMLRMFNPYTTPRDAFRPLDFFKFSHYFLVPYVAHYLIAEDLDCSLGDAYKVMIESGDAGEYLHPEEDDDEELDLIQWRNTRQIWRERGMAMAYDD